MKLCLDCHQDIPLAENTCPKCGYAPAQRGEFLAYAPALASLNDGFNPDLFARYAAIEANHFWFVGRNKILRGCMERYFPHSKNVLEIGVSEAGLFALEFGRLRSPSDGDFKLIVKCDGTRDCFVSHA